MRGRVTRACTDADGDAGVAAGDGAGGELWLLLAASYEAKKVATDGARGWWIAVAGSSPSGVLLPVIAAVAERAIVAATAPAATATAAATADADAGVDADEGVKVTAGAGTAVHSRLAEATLDLFRRG